MQLTDQNYWRDIFKQWSSSGLDQKTYCARNDLNYSQFVAWRSRLIEAGIVESARHGGQASAKANPGFTPVSIGPTVVKPCPTLELSLGHGVVLRMPVDV